ncbi:helicase RepA family protein [Skermanella rosea]|uniref:AAA family ATPase n=1 Tax=Skermanella rosea TaxID=1817965 RepID=UPI00193464BC|nr:AAA family ATPase [Skermanella rosea]UEM06358.1 helicase RepA family protein [Skermanella rosea]
MTAAHTGSACDPNFDWPGKADGKPMPVPDPDVMLEHLELLFGGDRCVGMLDGLIEISHTDKDGRLVHAKLFGLDELEDAAEHAAKVNAEVGVNTYVGMAVRKHDTPRDQRPKKVHVEGLTAGFVDWDAEGEGDSEAVRQKCAFLPPNFIVVTGKYPWTRSQGMWVLDEPLMGVEAIEGLLRPMAYALNGDKAVVNADRVMRLAGSVAWPHKAGRIREMTRLVTKFDKDGDKPRPSYYPQGQVLRAFQAAHAAQAEAERASAGPEASSAGTASSAGYEDKNPFTGRFDPAALIAKIRAGQWHDGMLKLTAHMVGMGWPDWLIELALDQFDDKTTPHKERPMDLVRQAREKYNKPNPPDPAADFDFSQSPPAPLSLASAADIVIEELERRPWLFGGWLMKGIISMMVGPGGQGKSMLSIHAALAFAAGMTWAGQKPMEQGGAWIWNNEDDLTELKRRVGGTAKHMGIDLRKLDGKLFLGSGVKNKHNPDARRLVLAREGEHGDVVAMPDVQTVIQIIKDNGIKLLVIDPMVSIHYVNENDNGAMQKVMDILLTVATEGDCSILLIHHTAKPGANVQQAGNQYISRGATSVPGAARLLLTVTQMTEDDAKFMMGEEYDERERERCIRVDTGKANMLPPGKDTTFLRKVSIGLGNGSGTRLEDDADAIGGLEVADFTEAQQEVKMRRQEWQDRLLDMVHNAMSIVPAGGEMRLKELVARIGIRTSEFGKERALRDHVSATVPMASTGGVRVGDFMYYRRQDGAHEKATIYVCKRDVV